MDYWCWTAEPEHLYWAARARAWCIVGHEEALYFQRIFGTLHDPALLLEWLVKSAQRGIAQNAKSQVLVKATVQAKRKARDLMCHCLTTDSCDAVACP